MEKKNLTRKDFLTNTSKYAVGAAVGVAGLNVLAGGNLLAGTKTTEWPWPYIALDPDVVRVKAHTLYYSDKDCCSGVFGGLLEPLKAAIGDPWTNLPMEIMLFGRGGGVGWGTLCGALNGGAAMISLVADKGSSGNLISELWGWSCQEELPTTVANEFATSGKYEIVKFAEALPQNVAGSPMCHASVSQWCNLAGKKIGDVERKERCARLAGDVAAKTAEILNAHFASTFTLTYADPDTIKQCMGCHGSAMLNNVMTRMDCVSCHGDPHGTTLVKTLPGKVENYNLSQNYPNPFNPSTEIEFAIPQQCKVDMVIYDIQGKQITKLIDHDMYNAGRYTVEWNGNDAFGARVASGIYFARLQAGDYMQTVKMNLLK
ncbi:MAG: hypothetical protein CVV23_04635 [Ignavibacteriae bacterium HGW-Ignavibacteriae-2]|jgi:hypothetical protein|nr:MAG: hypothetical protein CVV23_04635 [Ignavibacteriae bacterium HGW-Ignavibacteriae-2]